MGGYNEDFSAFHGRKCRKESFRIPMYGAVSFIIPEEYLNVAGYIEDVPLYDDLFPLCPIRRMDGSLTKIDKNSPWGCRSYGSHYSLLLGGGIA